MLIAVGVQNVGIAFARSHADPTTVRRRSDRAAFADHLNGENLIQLGIEPEHVIALVKHQHITGLGDDLKPANLAACLILNQLLAV